MKTKIGLVIHPEELDDTWEELLPPLGVSVLGIHPVGGKEAEESLERLLVQAKDPAFIRRVNRLEERGVSVEYQIHGLSYLVPRELFTNHPDWFRMNTEGERTPDCNCCPSSKEAMAHLTDSCTKLAEALPVKNHRYHIWADDIPNGGCHCQECQKLTRSDQMLKMVHHMLEGLKKVDPLAKLSYLAYDETLNAPEQIKPHPDVYLEYAPMTRDHHLPLDTPSCEKNQVQLRPLAGLLALFGTEGSTVLDYWMDNSMFSGWKKPPKEIFPDLPVAAADAASYRGFGIEYITTFACYLGEDYRELHGKPPITEFVEAVRGESQKDGAV